MGLAADLSELIDPRHGRLHRHAQSAPERAPSLADHLGGRIRQGSGLRHNARLGRRRHRGRGASAPDRRCDPQGRRRPHARGREVPRLQHAGGNPRDREGARRTAARPDRHRHRHHDLPPGQLRRARDEQPVHRGAGRRPARDRGIRRAAGKLARGLGRCGRDGGIAAGRRSGASPAGRPLQHDGAGGPAAGHRRHRRRCRHRHAERAAPAAPAGAGRRQECHQHADPCLARSARPDALRDLDHPDRGRADPVHAGSVRGVLPAPDLVVHRGRADLPGRRTDRHPRAVHAAPGAALGWRAWRLRPDAWAAAGLWPDCPAGRHLDRPGRRAGRGRRDSWPCWSGPNARVR